MNKVDRTNTTSGRCELVVAGAETPSHHAGSQVSLWYISCLSIKESRLLRIPGSAFDLNYFSSHHHQYFHHHHHHQISSSAALIDVFRVALPISIQSYCPPVSITCHRQTYIRHPCYFPSPVTQTGREGKKRRPEQSRTRTRPLASLLGLN